MSAQQGLHPVQGGRRVDAVPGGHDHRCDPGTGPEDITEHLTSMQQGHPRSGLGGNREMLAKMALASARDGRNAQEDPQMAGRPEATGMGPSRCPHENEVGTRAGLGQHVQQHRQLLEGRQITDIREADDSVGDRTPDDLEPRPPDGHGRRGHATLSADMLDFKPHDDIGYAHPIVPDHLARQFALQPVGLVGADLEGMGMLKVDVHEIRPGCIPQGKQSMFRQRGGRMAMTPRQREQVFEQLATLLESGIPLTGAWQRIKGDSREMARMGGRLERGWSLEETLDKEQRSGESPFAAWEVAWLTAGERGGQLPSTCAQLARHWAEQRATAARLRASLAYPAGLLVLLCLVSPVDRLLAEGAGGYLAGLISLLGTGLAFLFLAGLAFGLASRLPGLRSTLRLGMEKIPLLGTPWRLAAEVRLTQAMASLWRAGLPLDETWRLATAASGAPGLDEAGMSAAMSIGNGRPPDEAVAMLEHRFGTPWSTAYMTGEATGKLDQTLERHARRQGEALEAALRRLAQMTGHVAYVLVAALLVGKLARLYGGILGQIDKAMQGIY